MHLYREVSLIKGHEETMSEKKHLDQSTAMVIDKIK